VTNCEVIEYKGHACRCYGFMNEEQNTWYVTDTTDEEFVMARGFEDFNEALKYLVDRDIFPIELMGV
jgi:3-methyladenine DNA glycosylase AlkD